MDEVISIANAAAALGIGLLIGLERERHKGRGESRACAGLRTFAITSLLGYVCMQVAGGLLVGAVAICLAALVTTAYWKSQGKDPGITSEVALLTVLILGALCSSQPELAVAIGVVVAVLLAFRQKLHRFARSQLTEMEMRDGLVLLIAVLVVLPSLYRALCRHQPAHHLHIDRPADGGWRYRAYRCPDPGHRLWLRGQCNRLGICLQHRDDRGHGAYRQQGTGQCKGIERRCGAVQSLAMTGITLLSSAMLSHFGQAGVMFTAMFGGFADAHSTAASIASLAKAGQLPYDAITAPALIALSSNTLSKCLVAWVSGGRRFAAYVIPGQLVIIAVIWAGTLLHQAG